MFNFARRINRATFIAGILLSIVGLILLDLSQTLIEVVNQRTIQSGIVDTIQVVYIILGLAILVVYIICLARQRANDIGWHPLLLVVLIGLTPLMAILAVVPGLKSSNKYGLEPKPGLSIH